MKLKNKHKQIRNITIPITVVSLIVAILTSFPLENPDSIVYFVKTISEVILLGGIIVLAWLILDWFEVLFVKQMKRKIVEEYRKGFLISFQNSITFEREGPNDWLHK